MSWLVPFDYSVGRHVMMHGVAYRITKVARRASRVKLEPVVAESGAPMVLSLDQLATLLVRRDAQLVDELEDPEPDSASARKPPRATNDVSHLSLHRIIDWVVKVFLLRHMTPYMGAGPNSKRFTAAFGEGTQILAKWFAAVGIDDV